MSNLKIEQDKNDAEYGFVYLIDLDSLEDTNAYESAQEAFDAVQEIANERNLPITVEFNVNPYGKIKTEM